MTLDLSFADFELKAKSSDILFIDVRSDQEVADGHIKAVYWAHISRAEIEEAFCLSVGDFEVPQLAYMILCVIN